MLKRIATLLLGIGLIGLGILLFIAPERVTVVQIFMRFWPLFLLLAGLVRVAGFLIDRHPTSPVGGMMITAIGAVLLASNLRNEHSLLQIVGNHWFWLLLALVMGKVMRQYLHRIEDGPRPYAFSPVTIVFMLLIVCGGLTANYLAKRSQVLNDINASVNNYLMSSNHLIEDDRPQTFVLFPDTHLFLSNFRGDVEVKVRPQSQAMVKLQKNIYAAGDEAAARIAKSIYLQINSEGGKDQISVNAPGVQEKFTTTMIIELPQENLPAGVEVLAEDGEVTVADFKGALTINAARDIKVRNFRGPLNVRTERGAINLETDEKISADIRAVSENGKIQVTIPEDSKFRLDAATKSGRIRLDGFDQIIYQRTGKLMVEGFNIDMNAPVVNLRSDKGRIRLQSSGLALAAAGEDN
jgi:Putative adhesin